MIAVPAPIQRLFEWKVRGVRCVEIIGVACVIPVLALSLLLTGRLRPRTAKAPHNPEADVPGVL